MKVAIIGAGVSGLSCAFELKRHGITPTVYEKNNYIGDSLSFSTIWPRIFNRHKKDPLQYLKQQYALELNPTAELRKIVMISPNNKATVRGRLGYIMKKGREPYALEKQLHSLSNVPIHYDSYINIDDIRDSYEHIVIAATFNTIPKKLGIWSDTFTAHARVATVLGSFNDSTTYTWLNTEYAKNAFAYLIPNSSKEASLVLIVNGIAQSELDSYWKKFIESENISYHITTAIDAEHACGYVETYKLDNMYFAGNCAGFTDDLLGCGGLNAIESGILAAKAVASGIDYNLAVEPIFRHISRLHQFRKAFNTLENDDYDRILTVLGLPAVKQLIYNNPFFRIEHLNKYAAHYNELEKKFSSYK
ncbi:MAG: FAD-dependent oxidoreductase [Bacillota bacterium]